MGDSTRPIIVICDDHDTSTALRVAIAAMHDDVIVIGSGDCTEIAGNFDTVGIEIPHPQDLMQSKSVRRNKSDRKRNRANRWR